MKTDKEEKLKKLKKGDKILVQYRKEIRKAKVVRNFPKLGIIQFSFWMGVLPYKFLSHYNDYHTDISFSEQL